MSLISVVPAGVPFDFQSSAPCVGSVARKNSVLATFLSAPGNELSLPGLMSLTRVALPPAKAEPGTAKPTRPMAKTHRSRPLVIRLTRSRATTRLFHPP